ncbi:hypothetical protein AcV5_008234 [Taiwanofungus camphoratus]|nr:hypothetical protein AcV5_008234 [Antrodia cinnamomea]KAI0955612.1 hypothetical protein AcV7_006232 [Antrodia cinnamomea]
MLKSLSSTRYLLFLALAVAFICVPLVSGHDIIQRQHSPNARRSIAQRAGFSDLFPQPSDPAASSTGASSTSSATHSSSTPTPSAPSTSSATPSQTSSKPADTSSPPSSTPSSTASSTESTSSSSPPSTSSAPSSTNSASSTTPPSSSSATTALSTQLTTNSRGQQETVIVTVSASGSSAPSLSSSASAAQGTSSGSGGVSTSTIIGLSVAGGVGLIGVVAFIIWKFSRKRSSDGFDDNDIKWPELNAHGESPHALPTHRTGGAGFETSSEVNLTRPDSRAGSVTNSTAASASAVDLYPSQDPYAVPPLPHLNPNVVAPPYRDDPAASYYDPYNGPVPHTLEGEAIPMTQIGPRSRSPMPGMGGMDGRMSPAPGLGMAPPAARAKSPAPGVAYAGRTSPGPQVAYGAGGYGA